MSKLTIVSVAIDRIAAHLLDARDAARKNSAPPTKLTPAGALTLHGTDVVVTRLTAALKIATEIRDLARARYRDLVPLSEDPKESAKGIRVASVGRFDLRIAPVEGSERFSLKAYKEAGHAVTPEMREAMSSSNPFDRWTIKDTRGPRRSDAIEVGQL